MSSKPSYWAYGVTCCKHIMWVRCKIQVFMSKDIFMTSCVTFCGITTGTASHHLSLIHALYAWSFWNCHHNNHRYSSTLAQAVASLLEVKQSKRPSWLTVVMGRHLSRDERGNPQGLEYTSHAFLTTQQTFQIQTSRIRSVRNLCEVHPGHASCNGPVLEHNSCERNLLVHPQLEGNQS